MDIKIPSRPGVSLADAGLDHGAGEFLVLDSAAQAAGDLTGIKLPGLRRFLATYRASPWWYRPAFGATESEVPAEVHFLLYEKDDGRFGAIIPLADAGRRAYLSGASDGLALRLVAEEGQGLDMTAALFAEGDDPFALARAAVAAAARRLRTFRLREEKPAPRWIDLFGWCTWDAFYQDVTTERVLGGLRDWCERSPFRLPLLILDDGWQDDFENQLRTLNTHPERFPEGLAPLISAAKANGVECFGVWHALVGYWNGIRPDGPLASLYPLHVTTGTAYNVPGSAELQRALILPGHAKDFYHDYHARLAAAGVDMVKIDNQASLDHFCQQGGPAPTVTMAAYQDALQSSAHSHFGGETLHCMANTTEIWTRLDRAVVWRNSDDFYPRDPASHGRHIASNALNNFWTSLFAIPDWDMFQSDHPHAHFHALARALSGGPVYVSDVPGRQDFKLLASLCTADGRVLRFAQPALPSADCLFEDPQAPGRLLKIWNHQAGVYALGLFNCGEDPAKARVSSDSIPCLRDRACAVWWPAENRVRVLAPGESWDVTLSPTTASIAVLVPIEAGFACLGPEDKLVPPSALLPSARAGEAARLVAGGAVRLWSARPLKTLLCDDEPVAFEQDKDGFVRAVLPAPAPGKHLVLRILT